MIEILIGSSLAAFAFGFVSGALYHAWAIRLRKVE